MSLIIPANTLASGGYAVDNSCRFNDGSTDYLTKSTVTPTDNTKGTFSCWFKRGALGVGQTLFSGGTNIGVTSGTKDMRILISSSDYLEFYQDDYNVTGNNTMRFNNMALRDVSAWYHLVVAVDTGQASNTDKVKYYINGTQLTASYTSFSESFSNLFFNTASLYQHIGVYNYNTTLLFDGYMAEVVFIDGTALDPTSFGEFDADSGIWKPIDVSGLTFGTNGFYLDFENSGSLGADVSGNTNNFTVNNLTAIDQSTDTPTNNFCTLNSISEHNDSTFSDGNLTYTGNAAAVHMALGSIGVTQGKWYFEAKRVAGASAYPFVGVFNADGTMGSYLGQTVDGWSILMDAADNGEWRNNGTLSGTSVGAFVNGDIGMIAIDMDNGKIWFGRNGTWGDSGNPSAGSGEQYSNLTGTIIPAVAVYTGASISLNFGNAPYTISSGNTDGNSKGNFEYSVPSGYYALCTANLAEFG